MTDRKQTLVILSPGFPESEADTTCLPAHQVFVRALNKVFPQLKIIIIAFQYPFIAHEYTWNGNTVISINGQSKGKLKRLAVWLKVWRTLKKLYKKHNVTGLLSFWVTECALVGKHFGKRNNIQHFSWITGQDAKKGNLYAKLMHPKANEIFAMSDFLAKQFYNNYGVKPFTVIPNGIDIGLFSKNDMRRDIDIFAAGSLIPLKQYDVWVEVVRLITAELHDVQAVLCGKGPEEERLRRMIDALVLGKNIQLAGEKKHIEVLHTMQRSKVFLHTSNYEGFSTVCLEALYAGAHVVSFFRPMEKDIEHWHIVSTKEEMAKKALQILLDVNTAYKPVLAYAMDDIARAVIALYNI